MTSGFSFMLIDERGDKEHLHVVITDPDANGEVITVCVCTRKRRSETLTVLQPGDHPFIRHESVVAYMFAEIRKSTVIDEALERGLARAQAPVSERLLQRMRSGLVDSDFTPNQVRNFYWTTVAPTPPKAP